MVRPSNPDSYAKGLAIKLSESEYRKIKALAEKERRTIKSLLLTALDKAFPGWNEPEK